MSPDEAAHDLLMRATAGGTAEVFANSEHLQAAKDAADLLVAARLATFADMGRTQITLTNAGRYWALHGGFMGFLKEMPPGGGGGGRGRNPELEEVRLILMRRRLNTFWWSFGVSVAGFIFSVISLFVAVTIGSRLTP
jgi:hypothetical protein